MLLLTRVGCRRVREVFVEPLIRFLLEGYVDYWELLVEALVLKVLESFEGWVCMVFLVRLAEVSWADSRVRGRVVDEIVELFLVRIGSLPRRQTKEEIVLRE